MSALQDLQVEPEEVKINKLILWRGLVRQVCKDVLTSDIHYDIFRIYSAQHSWANSFLWSEYSIPLQKIAQYPLTEN